MHGPHNLTERTRKLAKQAARAGMGVCLSAVLGVLPAPAKDKKPHQVTVPVLQLDGGRKLVFERAFSSEKEVETKRGLWKRFVDVVAGAPDFKVMQRPYSIVTDSK